MILSEEYTHNPRFKIFVGWDSREDIAFQVCKHSIFKNTKMPNDVEVIPIKLDELRERGLYWRDPDELGSTEFTFSRFLVPELMNFDGWAVFCDCDFLFLSDIQKLFHYTEDHYAVMCVHHDYTPKEGMKMDGKAQLAYPRKNWSSMMLINCGHPSNKILTKELVNDPSTTGQFLHRFSWLKDNEIGQIPHNWNWLINWYQEPVNGTPMALHYTEGGPWFKEYERCDYAIDWLLMEKEYLKNLRKQEKQSKPKGPFEGFSPDKEILIEEFINYTVDPEAKVFGITLKDIENKVKTMGEKIAAIDSEGGINYADKGHLYDPILMNFIHGSGGYVSTWEREESTKNPLVIRGLGGGSRKAIQYCKDVGRTFYAIDTGYYGNGKHKRVHRVTKNALQQMGPIIERPDDRSRMFGYKFRKFSKGSKILICPPSLKVMETFGQSLDDWLDQTIKTIKVYTDRPIEVRLKPNRTERVTTKTIQAALQDDVHCLVTYNSIAAIEALMEGKPAVVLGPNAAEAIAETNLANIETPRIPSREEMDAFMAHLAYCQFTVEELKSGYAWKIINESSELPLWDPTKEQ